MEASKWPAESGAGGSPNYRSRRAGITLSVAGVSVLLLLIPLAAAGVTLPQKIVSAPFHGTVLDQNSRNKYGCGSLKVLEPAKFRLASGIGGFASKGTAITCPSSQFWLGTYGSNQANGEFQVATPVHVPLKTTHVAANLQASWDVQVTATDAGRAQCTQGSTWENNQYYAAWNYTKTTGGGAYYAHDNGSWSDRVTYPWLTTWGNGTNGNSAMIHPWNFNNTSFFQYYHSYGGSASCQAYGSVTASYSDYLFDETNGSYIAQTGNTLASTSGRQFFNLYVSLQNSTSWSCYNSTYWDGPSSSWSNGTKNCNYNNATVMSVATSYAPTYSSTSGSNNTVTLASSMVITGSWYWNYTFVRSHHYELFFDVQMVAYSGDTWTSHGSGAFYLNMGGISHGLRLSSITAT